MNTNTLRKIVAILLAILFVITLGTTNAWATEEEGGDGTGTDQPPVTPTFTDFSNATFSVTRDDISFYLNITGATLKKEDRRSYYLFLTNGNEEPNIRYSTSGYLDADLGKEAIYIRNEKESMGSYLTSRLEKAGDIYATIVEYDGEGYMSAIGTDKTAKDFHKVVVSKKKVTRPQPLPITQRMTGYFFKEHTTIFEWEMGGSNKDRKCNIKVGRVTDNNVLRAIKNGEKNCLSNLMNYAKNADAVYQTQLKADYSLDQRSIMNEFQGIDGAYYFVYFSLDTEKGKYYPVEDVMLYQCVKRNDLNDLLNYLDKNFAWNIEEAPEPSKPGNEIVVPPTKNNTVTNSNKPTGITGNMDNTKAGGTIPQTGSMPMITICILAVILLAGGFAYYQNRKYKGI